MSLQVGGVLPQWDSIGALRLGNGRLAVIHRGLIPARPFAKMCQIKNQN